MSSFPAHPPHLHIPRTPSSHATPYTSGLSHPHTGPAGILTTRAGSLLGPHTRAPSLLTGPPLDSTAAFLVGGPPLRFRLSSHKLSSSSCRRPRSNTSTALKRTHKQSTAVSCHASATAALFFPPAKNCTSLPMQENGNNRMIDPPKTQKACMKER